MQSQKLPLKQRVDDHERRIDGLDDKTNRIGKELRSARLASNEAFKGYVEMFAEVKHFKADFVDLKTQSRKTTKWLIGLFFSSIGLILSIAGLIVTILRFWPGGK
jgi:hypothetical protein